MKDVYKVLQQKEADLARVRREVESLHIVASLLSTQSATEESAENFGEMAKKPASSAEEGLEPAEETQATGTGDMFSSVVPPQRSHFWKILKRDS